MNVVTKASVSVVPSNLNSNIEEIKARLNKLRSTAEVHIKDFYVKNLQWKESRKFVLDAYLYSLSHGGEFSDYRFICEKGQRYWKDNPIIAKFGLSGMKRTIERPKHQRIILENAKSMEKLGWM